MVKTHKIEFPDTEFATLELPEGSKLSENLTLDNSPVLFGCCNGICATCLVEVEAVQGQLPPPSEDELETLEIYAEGNSKARLACQLALNTDLKIKVLNK